MGFKLSNKFSGPCCHVHVFTMLQFHPLSPDVQRVTLNQAIDKWSGSRSGIIPLCHDINEIAMSVDFVPVVLGFQTGSIVYYNPMKKKTVLQLNCSVSGCCSVLLQAFPGMRSSSTLHITFSTS